MRKMNSALYGQILRELTKKEVEISCMINAGQKR